MTLSLAPASTRQAVWDLFLEPLFARSFLQT